MSRMQPLIDQIVFARFYTNRLLDTVDPADWFRTPVGGVSHIAWQVGHLAMAQYRLALERLRGHRPEDEALISNDFLLRFGRDSVADPDPARNPTVDEIRAVYDRVHERTLKELSGFLESDLDVPPLKPHALCQTKWECLRWCSHHEMLHAGQIGLIRRLLGAKPVW